MAGYNNWEQFYHKYNLIFNGLVAVPLIPFSFIFLETQKEFPDAPLLEGTIATIATVILMLISALSIYFSFWYKKTIPSKVDSVSEIEMKLKRFLEEKIRQYAILEVAALCGIVGLWLTKDHLFSFAYVVVLFVYSLSRPTFDSVVRETMISASELNEWGKSSKK